MRRDILIGAPIAFLMAACGRTQTSVAAATAPVQAPAPGFLRVSQALTGKWDLDAVTAGRLDQVFLQVMPDDHAKFESLGKLIRYGMSPSEALGSATAAGLGPVALAIVAAWYTGSVGKGVDTLTVSYHDALMHRPVADALPPPTYVLGGPAWWAASPPDVGLPAPVQRRAAPSTAGTTAPRSR